MTDRPKSIGRVRSFFGNVGVLIRAYCYIRTYGPDGLRAVSENAVLNANYLLSRVKHFLPVPQGDRCMHEFVASAAALKKAKGITAMDLAKRLLDYGFHAPTVYFPLTVPEAMMIEPTETESKETLDAFAEALFRLTEETPGGVARRPAYDARESSRRSPGGAQAGASMECRLIFDPPADGAWNMALGRSASGVRRQGRAGGVFAVLFLERADGLLGLLSALRGPRHARRQPPLPPGAAFDGRRSDCTRLGIDLQFHGRRPDARPRRLDGLLRDVPRCVG